MSSASPQPAIELGRGFPYRLLQWMPHSWKQDYLLKQAGGVMDCPIFDLGRQLKDARSLVVTWPSTPERVLMALPVVQNLTATLPSLRILHLAEADCLPFLMAVYPSNSLEQVPSPIYGWHDAPLEELRARLAEFRPEVSLCLMERPRQVWQALLKSSRATLRIQLGEEGHFPYANVTVAPPEPYRPLAHFLSILGLWRYADLPIGQRWTRLRPGNAAREGAKKRLSDAGLDGGSWMFLATNRLPASVESYRRLGQTLQERSGSSKWGWLHWKPAFPGEIPSTWSKAPRIETESLEELLALLEESGGALALSGWGLHFAALADTRLLALLHPTEADQDTSGLNSLAQTEWLGQGWPESLL